MCAPSDDALDPQRESVREWDKVKIGETSPGEKERERERRRREREEEAERRKRRSRSADKTKDKEERRGERPELDGMGDGTGRGGTCAFLGVQRNVPRRYGEVK